MTLLKNSMLNDEGSFTSRVDGKKHGFITSVPLDYDAKRQYNLLVFLHGAGEKPNAGDVDLAKLKAHGPHKEIYSKKRSFQAIITSIQMEKWGAKHEPAVIKEHIDNICKQYNVDPGRIHLTGLSQGGADAYKTAAAYPGVFASISVFSAYTSSMSDMQKIKIPAYIRHNSGDITIGVTNAYNAQKWINAAKPSEAVNLLLYAKSGHDAWSTPYASEELYTWHFSKSRSLVKVPVIVIDNPVEQASQLPEPLEVNTIVHGIDKKNIAGIDITFNKPISKGLGIVSIKENGKEVSTVSVKWDMVRLSDDKVTIYPVTTKPGKEYIITIPAGSFVTAIEQCKAIEYRFSS